MYQIFTGFPEAPQAKTRCSSHTDVLHTGRTSNSQTTFHPSQGRMTCCMEGSGWRVPSRGETSLLHVSPRRPHSALCDLQNTQPPHNGSIMRDGDRQIISRPTPKLPLLTWSLSRCLEGVAESRVSHQLPTLPAVHYELRFSTNNINLVIMTNTVILLGSVFCC